MFVEGPSDKAALDAWSETLRMSFTEHNVTVISMGGGEYADRGAPIRTEVLEGISSKAPVPHLFVLDQDERGLEAIESLRKKLGERLHLLEARELENYLLVPRALLSVLRAKYRDNDSILARIERLSEGDVPRLFREQAERLYGTVLLKRIRAELKGLPGGMLTREMVAELIPDVGSPVLAKLLAAKIEQRLQVHFTSLDIGRIVQDQKTKLDAEWAVPENRLRLAPGEELLGAVYEHIGSSYRKSKDVGQIAQEMQEREIDSEIREVIKKVVALSATGMAPSEFLDGDGNRSKLA